MDAQDDGYKTNATLGITNGLSFHDFAFSLAAKYLFTPLIFWWFAMNVYECSTKWAASEQNQAIKKENQKIKQDQSTAIMVSGMIRIWT